MNLDDACDSDDFNGLNFNLICTVEQPGYYNRDRNEKATVMDGFSNTNGIIICSGLAGKRAHNL